MYGMHAEPEFVLWKRSLGLPMVRTIKSVTRQASRCMGTYMLCITVASRPENEILGYDMLNKRAIGPAECASVYFLIFKGGSEKRSLKMLFPFISLCYDLYDGGSRGHNIVRCIFQL